MESKLKCNTDDVPCILAYATLPNKKIKANLEIGMKGFQESVYFDSEEELEKYKQDNSVTFSIEGLDIDKI